MFALTFRVPWICVIICCSTFKFLNSESAHDDCRTPNNELGNCIPAKQCKAIVRYIQSIPTVTPEIKKQLRGYECGIQESEIKVCCPNTTIAAEVQEGPQKNVEKHRNRNLLPIKCGMAEHSRLIGGSRTTLFEIPFVALLAYKTENGTNFHCTGSIINNRYILTAAHCLSNTNFELTGVRCGEHNLNTEIDCEDDISDKTCADPVQDMDIEEVILHPDYNLKTHENDISLIRLAAPLNTSVDTVQPICLPVYGNLNNSLKWLSASSWGLRGKKSSILQKSTMEFVSHENCQKAYASFSIPINDKQLCASQKNNYNWCGGDSGGPLYTERFVDEDVRSVQYGVVSIGPRQCDALDVPFVYTKIESYIEWILDNLRP